MAPLGLNYFDRKFSMGAMSPGFVAQLKQSVQTVLKFQFFNALNINLIRNMNQIRLHLKLKQINSEKKITQVDMAHRGRGQDLVWGQGRTGS